MSILLFLTTSPSDRFCVQEIQEFEFIPLGMRHPVRNASHGSGSGWPGVPSAWCGSRRQLELGALNSPLTYVLGLAMRVAPVVQIKRAYRECALRWHPDKNPENDTSAAEAFREVKHTLQHPQILLSVFWSTMTEPLSDPGCVRTAPRYEVKPSHNTCLSSVLGALVLTTRNPSLRQGHTRSREDSSLTM